MEIFIKILQFVASLSLLVIVHELGHFLFAKIFGVRVEKFYLFFNPGFSLFKFKKGDTEYGIGWVPLGGYVKLSGMIDESMDTEQMKQPPQPYEFRSKPAWQRLLIMTGGVIMNVVLAVIIYIGITFKYGEQYIANEDLRYGYSFSDLGHEAGFRNGDRILSVGGKPVSTASDAFFEIVISNAEVEVLRDGEITAVRVPKSDIEEMLNYKSYTDLLRARFPFVIGKVVPGDGAAKAGLQPQDSLVAFNGEPTIFYDQYQKLLQEHKGGTVDLTVIRDSSGVAVEKTLPVEVSDAGLIGVSVFAEDYFFPVRTHTYTFLQSIPAGVKLTGAQISDYWKQFKLIFTPGTKAYKNLGGFISIGSIFPGTWEWDRFWSMTAFLSIILAVMNILPIPALDGGHVLFLLVEVVSGRKPGDKFMEYATTAGLFLLLALILYANVNDIYRFFIK